MRVNLMSCAAIGPEVRDQRSEVSEPIVARVGCGSSAVGGRSSFLIETRSQKSEVRSQRSGLVGGQRSVVGGHSSYIKNNPRPPGAVFLRHFKVVVCDAFDFSIKAMALEV